MVLTCLAPIRRWELWTAPARVIALVLVVGGAAVATLGLAIEHGSVGSHDTTRFAVLALLSVGYVAVCQRLERARLLFAVSSGAVHVDVLSVWTFAAAVLLPPILTAVLVAVVYLQWWYRSSGHPDGRPRPHKFIYNAAATWITCYVVATVVPALNLNGSASRPADAAMALGLALPVYLATNTVIIAAAFYASTGTRSPSALLGSWADNGLELATLVLGGITAVSVLYAPWAAVLVLPAVFLFQHQALLRQLVQAATTDVKTDLLNATAWRQIAEREVKRAGQRGGSAAILVLDMDHFKHINDQHGHLTGDAALKSVAAALADELRGYDAVGRFGGEEFVAVLPDTGPAGAEHAAERLRRRIESLAVAGPGGQPLAVTASIGVALCPEHGRSVDEVLSAADDAMYQAKRAGRNAVRTAPAARLRTAAS
jgi:diguanylate cyclase (GGDEF)-like protein